MLHLDQMFPRKSLDPADVGAFAPEGVVVTIESIEVKTAPAQKPGDVEVLYYVSTREFKKPFKLNTYNAYAIGDVLQTKFPDQWTGRTIKLIGRQKMGTNPLTGRPSAYWTFDVDLVAPTEPPALPPKQDISGWAATGKGPAQLAAAPARPQIGGQAPPGQGAMSPIGEDKAGEIFSALHERGRTSADFIKHLRDHGTDDLVRGKQPPAWPAAVLPPARSFCQLFPRVNPALSPIALASLKAGWKQPEVIDTTTGEVITPEQQVEDDIPF